MADVEQAAPAVEQAPIEQAGDGAPAAVPEVPAAPEETPAAAAAEAEAPAVDAAASAAAKAAAIAARLLATGVSFRKQLTHLAPRAKLPAPLCCARVPRSLPQPSIAPPLRLQAAGGAAENGNNKRPRDEEEDALQGPSKRSTGALEGGADPPGANPAGVSAWAPLAGRPRPWGPRSRRGHRRRVVSAVQGAPRRPRPKPLASCSALPPNPCRRAPWRSWTSPPARWAS